MDHPGGPWPEPALGEIHGRGDRDFTAVGFGPLLSLTKSKSGGLQGGTRFWKLWDGTAFKTVQVVLHW